MVHRSERVKIEAEGGTALTIIKRRFGTEGARPKVYVQATTHTEELPGAVALHHLTALLDEAERNGLIPGEVVIVPFANPVGLAQAMEGTPLGRNDLKTGLNFNLGWPALPVAVPGEEVQSVRARIKDHLDRVMALTTLGRLRLVLLREAYDADIALDLHCTSRSLPFAFVNQPSWPAIQPLAAALELDLAILSKAAGSTTFEDTLIDPWLARRGEPFGCVACTVELRGMADVNDELAAKDAAGLFRFLCSAGAVTAERDESLVFRGRTTEFEHVHSVPAPVAGILLMKVRLGAEVRQGDLIAELLDPLADYKAARVPVLAPCSGLLFHTHDPALFLHAGRMACAIASDHAPAPEPFFVDGGSYG